MSHTKIGTLEKRYRNTFFIITFLLGNRFNSKACNRVVMVFVVAEMVAKTIFSHTRPVALEKVIVTV